MTLDDLACERGDSSRCKHCGRPTYAAHRYCPVLLSALVGRLADLERRNEEDLYLAEEQCEVKMDLDPDPACECSGCVTRLARGRVVDAAAVAE